MSEAKIQLLIPGKKDPVKANQLIDRSLYFTWGEALHNLERVPTSYEVTANIIKLASELDVVRAKIGTPIIVQSWYRDPESNRRAGGVPNSEHLYGMACDWHPLNGRYESVKSYLDAKWKGGLGCYGDWFHTDIGPYGRWVV
jgi:uncharacterized protein YcbK (DUF882 family)